MFNRLNKKNERGFTLIELMIVIAIIGILAAIAIPQFSAYRTRAFNAAALSDLKNAITAQEAYFVDSQTYTGDDDGVYSRATNFLLQSDYGVQFSDDVRLTVNTANTAVYNMEAYNSKAGAAAVTYTVRGPGGTIGKE